MMKYTGMRFCDFFVFFFSIGFYPDSEGHMNLFVLQEHKQFDICEATKQAHTDEYHKSLAKNLCHWRNGGIHQSGGGGGRGIQTPPPRHTTQPAEVEKTHHCRLE